MLDKISEIIEMASLSTFICEHLSVDFNVYHFKWFNHSNIIDIARIQTLNFSVVQSHNQIVAYPTRFHNNNNYLQHAS